MREDAEHNAHVIARVTAHAAAAKDEAARESDTPKLFVIRVMVAMNYLHRAGEELASLGTHEARRAAQNIIDTAMVDLHDAFARNLEEQVQRAARAALTVEAMSDARKALRATLDRVEQARADGVLAPTSDAARDWSAYEARLESVIAHLEALEMSR